MTPPNANTSVIFMLILPEFLQDLIMLPWKRTKTPQVNFGTLTKCK